MRSSSHIILMLAIFFLLAAAPTVFANAIAPMAYFMPGVLPMMLGLAVPASVLAAFLERPFVKWAGVREYTLWYSLQANLISLVIGYITIPVGINAIYAIGPLWSIIAVAISVISERWYYQWRCAEGTKIRWLPVIAGNVFSSFVLVFISWVTPLIKKEIPTLEWKLAPYQGVLLWGSVGVCGLLFVVSFFVPRLLRWAKAGQVVNHFLGK